MHREKNNFLDNLLGNFRKIIPSGPTGRISRIHRNSLACPKPVFFLSF